MKTLKKYVGPTLFVIIIIGYPYLETFHPQYLDHIDVLFVHYSQVVSWYGIRILGVFSIILTLLLMMVIKYRGKAGENAIVSMFIFSVPLFFCIIGIIALLLFQLIL